MFLWIFLSFFYEKGSVADLVLKVIPLVAFPPDFIQIFSTLNPKPVCSDFSAIVSKDSKVSKDCVVWMVDATVDVEVGIWCLKDRHTVLGIAVNHLH